MKRSFVRLAYATIIVFLALSMVMTKTTAAPQVFSCTGVTEIPQVECAALVTLYDSTTGVHWKNHSNWLVTNTPSNWFGVTLSGAHVASLSLDTNILNGSIPPELGNLTGLTSLDLNWNALTGSIPSQLSSLANLTYLDLHYNQLSGSIPPELGSLANLTVLSLSYNQLTGSIPSQLASLAHLTNLDLNYNQLSGSIPPGLGNLANLIWLELDYNQLSGSIPPELAGLVNLTDLGLAGNQLSGVIPIELGSLANLTSLGLWGNRLSGAIPPVLGSLTNLTSLALDSNQLSGAIPPVLGSLTKLTALRLDSNDLSGGIPHELGNLTNLNLFWLDSNGLSGAIPPELINLTNLSSLGLNYNWLTVPDPYPSDPPTPLDLFLMNHASGWETTQGVIAHIPVSGGQVQSKDGRVLVTVPSGGVSQPVTLVLTSLLQPGHATGKLVFANTSFKLAAYDSGGILMTPFNFVQPVTVTLSYLDNDVAGQDESQLILYYWDAPTSSWKDAAQTCVPPAIYQRNLTNNTLSVQVCHLTEFALMVYIPPVIDTTAPTVNTFTVTTQTNNLNIPITAFSATDDTAVTGYLITTSSTPPAAGATGWTGTAPATYAVASDGSYTLYPWAKDAAGNVSAVFASPPAVVVDTTGPDTQIDSHPANPSNSADANFTFSSADDTATFECSLEGGAFTACTNPKNYTGLAAGSHTFAVRAKDPAGNVDATPASYTWMIDLTAPTVVSSVRADPNPTSATSVHFMVTFSEAVTGVDTADYSLTTTGTLSSASVTGVSGSGTTYTVTVSTGKGCGTLRLDIPVSATITDGVGNTLGGLPYTSGETYTIVCKIFLPLVSKSTP